MQIKTKIILGKKIKGAAKTAKYFRSYGTSFRKNMNHLSKKSLKIQESWFGLSSKVQEKFGRKKLSISFKQKKSNKIENRINSVKFHKVTVLKFLKL